MIRTSLLAAALTAAIASPALAVDTVFWRCPEGEPPVACRSIALGRVAALGCAVPQMPECNEMGGDRTDCSVKSTNCRSLIGSGPCRATEKKVRYQWGTLCMATGKPAPKTPPPSMSAAALTFSCKKGEYEQADCLVRAKANYTEVGCAIAGGGCQASGDKWVCRLSSGNCKWPSYGSACAKGYQLRSTSERGVCVKGGAKAANADAEQGAKSGKPSAQKAPRALHFRRIN